MTTEMNDAEWNKMIDDHIIEINNEMKGIEKIRSAPEYIMTDEFDRGINNRLVTEDLIRHYSDAIG